MLRVVQNGEEFYIYHFMSNMGLSFFGVVVVGCDCFFIVTRRPDGPVFFLQTERWMPRFHSSFERQGRPDKTQRNFCTIEVKTKGKRQEKEGWTSPVRQCKRFVTRKPSSFKEEFELEGCISQALRSLRIRDFYSKTPCGDVMPRVVVLWKLEFTILSELHYDVAGLRQISRPFLNCKLIILF